MQDRVLYPSLMQKQVLIWQILINLRLIQDGGAEKELSA